jgi:hypothetical protein
MNDGAGLVRRWAPGLGTDEKTPLGAIQKSTNRPQFSLDTQSHSIPLLSVLNLDAKEDEDKLHNFGGRPRRRQVEH